MTMSYGFAGVMLRLLIGVEQNDIPYKQQHDQ